jgi:hypothetical protein
MEIVAGAVPYNKGSELSLITTPTPATVDVVPSIVLRILTTGARTKIESAGAILAAVKVKVSVPCLGAAQGSKTIVVKSSTILPGLVHITSHDPPVLVSSVMNVNFHVLPSTFSGQSTKRLYFLACVVVDVDVEVELVEVDVELVDVEVELVDVDVELVDVDVEVDVEVDVVDVEVDVVDVEVDVVDVGCGQLTTTDLTVTKLVTPAAFTLT